MKKIKILEKQLKLLNEKTKQCDAPEQVAAIANASSKIVETISQSEAEFRNAFIEGYLEAQEAKEVKEWDMKRLIEEKTGWKIRALLIVQLIEAVGLLMLKLALK